MSAKKDADEKIATTEDARAMKNTIDKRFLRQLVEREAKRKRCPYCGQYAFKVTSSPTTKDKNGVLIRYCKCDGCGYLNQLVIEPKLRTHWQT